MKRLDLTSYQSRINQLLNNCLNSASTPTLLLEAMRYAALNDGKRLRPILVYLSGESLGVSLEQLDAAAIAIELVHCYSLVHDDLPCMDDAELRRGKPSCHMAYGIANAVLVGDALQSLAFEVIAADACNSNETKIAMISNLAKAIGSSGMIGGQMLDLMATSGMSEQALRHIHSLKTGCLISACVHMGILASPLDNEPMHGALSHFAEKLGLAYQIQDDILDAIGNAEKMGKPTSQDINKLSFTNIMSIDDAKLLTDNLLDSAKESLALLGKSADNLIIFMNMINQRGC